MPSFLRFRTGRTRTRQLERPPRPDHPHPRYPRANERQKIHDALERVENHSSAQVVATGNSGIVAAGNAEKVLTHLTNVEQKSAEVAQLQFEQKSGMPLIDINSIDSVSTSFNSETCRARNHVISILVIPRLKKSSCYGLHVSVFERHFSQV